MDPRQHKAKTRASGSRYYHPEARCWLEDDRKLDRRGEERRLKKNALKWQIMPVSA